MKKEMILIFGMIFLIGLVSAVGEISYCAEKTTDGAWCQNVPIDKVDQSFRYAPTSCESTSYCKLGTCINSQEGTCMKNTPQRVCQESKGLWQDADPTEIAQCQLGCCMVGNQAAFVTQTRCKRLSSLYGLETNFRNDLRSEFLCIASASSEVKGACVFEKEFERTCLFITQRECSALTSGGETSFYEGLLCSAESLGTNCGPTQKTTCVEESDEVRFLDSCGNVANIYDSSKINDKDYWSKVYGKLESCNPSGNNANSASCGNCDYYLGSVCKAYQRGQDNNPTYGDNVCRNLGCVYEGQTYQHGETWCANSKGITEGLPGSRAFRMVCYNNEVTVEPCADFRQETCIQSEVNGFSAAACRVNRWQDCTAQTNRQNCENIDRRDCKWLIDGCFPLLPPGLNFWEIGTDPTQTRRDSSSTQTLCAQVNKNCIVEFETDLLGGATCVKNCECLDSNWEKDQATMCMALGDCGGSTNYLGFAGYNEKGYIIKSKELKEDSKG